MSTPNAITISFRAKRDQFSGGWGYKVPTLTSNHVSVAERDMLGVTIMGALGKVDITQARLERYAGIRGRGVVFEDNPDGWTITPRGNGFMADVTITATLGKRD